MLHKLLYGLMGISLIAIAPAFGLEKNTTHADTTQLTLTTAMMCERIKSCSPDHQAVVFSTKIGEVSCFTTFDQISHDTFVFHKWC